ncbi:hypothetical protein C1646_808980 [Rhizophagus diaphanus]|nr:hypothetical protein C1646_808980 [Rhizophagus diaphanus] [Rhizophagus sp. MUCL 43196]
MKKGNLFLQDSSVQGILYLKIYSTTWYSYTNITSSKDYIRATSRYYNEPSFSNMLINMSEEESEDYNTYEGACFGKAVLSSLDMGFWRPDLKSATRSLKLLIGRVGLWTRTFLRRIVIF